MGLPGKIRDRNGKTGFKNPAYQPFPQTVHAPFFFFRAQSKSLFSLKESRRSIQQGYHSPSQARPYLQKAQKGAQGGPQFHMLIESPGYIKKEFIFRPFPFNIRNISMNLSNPIGVHVLLYYNYVGFTSRYGIDQI
jgi:hypothetical protein